MTQHKSAVVMIDLGIVTFLTHYLHLSNQYKCFRETEVFSTDRTIDHIAVQDDIYVYR
jgi:hypothetical protein